MTTTFEFLGSIEYQDKHYFLAMEAQDAEEEYEEDEEGEVIVFRIETDPENGEDYYVPEEDDETADAVFQLFMQEMEEEE